MVDITGRAASTLAERQGDGVTADGTILRLSEEDGRIQLSIEVVRESDNVLEFDETPILAVDRALDERIPDWVVDVEDTAEGPKLTIGPAGQA